MDGKPDRDMEDAEFEPKPDIARKCRVFPPPLVYFTCMQVWVFQFSYTGSSQVTNNPCKVCYINNSGCIQWVIITNGHSTAVCKTAYIYSSLSVSLMFFYA